MIYLDASALVKLVVAEEESEELVRFVSDYDQRASSIVAAVEVPRAVRRAEEPEDSLDRVGRLLSGVDLARLDPDVIAVATRLLPRSMRSLDAIHVGTALTLKAELEAFVAYDGRMLAAARESGLPVTSPGR